MDWLTWLIVGVTAVGLVYAAICVFLARVFTRVPPRHWTWPLRANPDDRGLPYEDVTFSASDGLHISGWWLPAGSTAVVMIHGVYLNRLNDNSNFPDVPDLNLAIAASLTSRGHSVLMYDSRGRGGSDDSRTGWGSLESRDLVGALDWLAERGFAPNDVAVMAFSMGAASAMFALKNRSYAGLIADGGLGGFSIDDVTEVASAVLRLPRGPARVVTIVFMNGVFAAARLLWGMRLNEQPSSHLRANPIPTLVIHGDADREVPVRVGRQIAEAAGAKLIGAHYPEGIDHLQAFSSDPDWYIATTTDALDVMFAERAVAPAAAR